MISPQCWCRQQWNKINNKLCYIVNWKCINGWISDEMVEEMLHDYRIPFFFSPVVWVLELKQINTLESWSHTYSFLNEIISCKVSQCQADPESIFCLNQYSNDSLTSIPKGPCSPSTQSAFQSALKERASLVSWLFWLLFNVVTGGQTINQTHANINVEQNRKRYWKHRHLV